MENNMNKTHIFTFEKISGKETIKIFLKTKEGKREKIIAKLSDKYKNK